MHHRRVGTGAPGKPEPLACQPAAYYSNLIFRGNEFHPPGTLDAFPEPGAGVVFHGDLDEHTIEREMVAVQPQ